MKPITVWSYIAGVATIAAGILLTPKNPTGGASLMTAGGWWLGKLQRQPHFAKQQRAGDRTTDVTPPPVVKP